MRMFLVGLFVMLVTVAGLAPPARADDRDAPLFGRITVEGIIISVDPGSAAFLLRVFKSGRAQRFRLGYLPVWVQRGTRVGDEDDNWFSHTAVRGFHRGDRVVVDGFRLDDGRLLALAIDVRERALASPVVSGDIICRGVVVARGPNLIVVLDTGGTRIIIISATTRFHGLRASQTALQANDRVVIVGQANADGTVAARAVEVTGVSR